MCNVSYETALTKMVFHPLKRIFFNSMELQILQTYNSLTKSRQYIIISMKTGLFQVKLQETTFQTSCHVKLQNSTDK